MSRENGLDDCKPREVKEGRGRKDKIDGGLLLRHMPAQVGVTLSTTTPA